MSCISEIAPENAAGKEYFVPTGNGWGYKYNVLWFPAPYLGNPARLFVLVREAKLYIISLPPLVQDMKIVGP